MSRSDFRRVYGTALPGKESFEIADPQIALLLAEADATWGPLPGAVFDGEVLRLVARPGAGSGDRRVRSADLPSIAPDLVLAGAEVIRTNRADDLRRFAERAVVGVVNTFTAKGLFRWDSPWHFGTACLQERDLELVGAGAAHSVLAVGVDHDEVPLAVLESAGLTLDDDRIAWLSPDELPAVAEQLAPASRQPPGRPRLYTELAAVVQPMYRLESLPLSPARAAAELAETVGDDATIVCEPGRAGFWLARTIPTTRLGSVRVPAVGRAGIAVAGALSVALDGGHGVAVVDAPLSETAHALFDLARQRRLSLTVIAWSERSTLRSADDHREQLTAALASPTPVVLEVGVDFSLVDRLIDVAGPICAWALCP